MSPHPSGRSSAPPTRTSAESFSLSGPTELPDPATHAYRADLADVALAGRLIASHYAQPLQRTISVAAELRRTPASDGDVIGQLEPGDRFDLLDDSVGWAWGYAGADRLVGYVPSTALTH